MSVSVLHYIFDIRRIRKFLSFEAAKTLIQALVISRQDYCNSVLHGIPAILTNKLQRIQITAARPLTEHATLLTHHSSRGRSPLPACKM